MFHPMIPICCAAALALTACAGGGRARADDGVDPAVIALPPDDGTGFPPAVFRWRVTRVIDGDTIEVIQRSGVYPERKERVRLLNINTPERGQPLYAEATAALRAMAQNAAIRLVFDRPDREKKDRYQRLLAYVFRGDRCLNVAMVDQGWTPYWTKYGKSRRFHDRFALAQQRARRRGLGMWRSQTAASLLWPSHRRRR